MKKMYIGKLWNTFPYESSVNEPSPIHHVRSHHDTIFDWIPAHIEFDSSISVHFGIYQAVKSAAL